MMGPSTCLAGLVVALTAVRVSGKDSGGYDWTEWEEKETEAYVRSVLLLLCAVCLSFFGTVVAYFSFAEDQLMCRFKEEGIMVRGSVFSADFARRGQAPASNPKLCDRSYSVEPSAHVEYHAVVDYKCHVQMEQHVSSTWVRKQMKVLGCDFIEPEIPHLVKVHIELTEELTNPLPFEPGPRDIHILVLPDNKFSGIAKNQVDRVCSWSYRLSTISMIFVLVLFTGACVLFCLSELPNELSLGWWTILVTWSLFLFELALVYFCLDATIERILSDEYLYGGEKILHSADSTSISSGDDSYLLM